MDQLPAGYSPGPPASNPRPERSSSTLTGPWSEEDARSDESPATGLLDGTSDEIANKIEDMLEGVVDALVKNQPMTIPLRSRRSGNETMVTFPALTSAGSRKFGRLIRKILVSPSYLDAKLTCLFPSSSRSAPSSVSLPRGPSFWDHHDQEVCIVGAPVDGSSGSPGSQAGFIPIASLLTHNDLEQEHLLPKPRLVRQPSVR